MKTHAVSLKDDDGEMWKEFTLKIPNWYLTSQKGPEINLY